MRCGSRPWAWISAGLATAAGLVQAGPAQAQTCRDGTVTVDGGSPRIERRCFFTTPRIGFGDGSMGGVPAPGDGMPRAPGGWNQPRRPFNEYDKDDDGKLDCWKSAAGKPSEARISSGYGRSTWRTGDFHYGVDITSHTANFGLGQQVRAISDGVVTQGATTRENGNFVRVTHNDGRVSLYLHLRDILRTEGRVRAGDVIGTMNCTGFCGRGLGANQVQSTHVHIEIKTTAAAPRTPPNRINLISYLGECRR